MREESKFISHFPKNSLLGPFWCISEGRFGDLAVTWFRQQRNSAGVLRAGESFYVVCGGIVLTPMVGAGGTPIEKSREIT